MSGDTIESRKLSPLSTWQRYVIHPDSGLNRRERLVALTLSMHMSVAGGSCFPSQETLAAETGMSRSMVYEALASMRDAGWITVTVARSRRDQRRLRNYYTASVPPAIKAMIDRLDRELVDDEWIVSNPSGQPDGVDPSGGPDASPPENRTQSPRKPRSRGSTEGSNEGSPESPPAASSPPPEGRTKRTRGERLPHDWSPTPELVAKCRGEFPDVDVATETDAFIDHWLSSTRNATKLDWDRAFRGWFRKEQKRLNELRARDERMAAEREQRARERDARMNGGRVENLMREAREEAAAQDQTVFWFSPVARDEPDIGDVIDTTGRLHDERELERKP